MLVLLVFILLDSMGGLPFIHNSLCAPSTSNCFWSLQSRTDSDIRLLVVPTQKEYTDL